MAFSDHAPQTGGEPAYAVHPGPDGTFTFSRDGRQDTERCELSPEGQAQKQMIEETYRRLTDNRPTTTQE